MLRKNLNTMSKKPTVVVVVADRGVISENLVFAGFVSESLFTRVTYRVLKKHLGKERLYE